MRSILYTVASVLLVASSCASHAQTGAVDVVPAFPNLSFNQPTDIQNAGDGSERLFVCEKGGIIRVFTNDPNASSTGTFLDLSGRVVTGSEMGLLGLAFHPNYAENGYFYVNYNIDRDGTLLTVISRFTVDPEDPDKADVESELVLIEFEQPFANHDGGQVAFGPDGYLYIATGDGGSGGDPLNSGQSLDTWLGKILRINVDIPASVLNYTIPEDNPFAGHEQNRNEIYAYGLRNPWRFSFDPETGRLWAADVGQDAYEEINIIENGKNYGWRVMEGWHCFNPRNNCDSTGMTGPVWEYGRELGASITGGYVYRGQDVPELQGKYVYADFVTGRIWALTYDEGESRVTENMLLEDTDVFISTFGTDEQNELYVGGFNGQIYKFEVASGVKDGEAQGSAGAQLRAIRPNPANSHMRIPYDLKERTAVVLALYNGLGQEIARLVDREQGPGAYEVEFDASRLTETIYYCRLLTSEGVTSRPFTVVR